MNKTNTIGDIVKAILLPPAFVLCAYVTYCNERIAYQSERQLYIVRSKLQETFTSELYEQERELDSKRNSHNVGMATGILYCLILSGYGFSHYAKIFRNRKFK